MPSRVLTTAEAERRQRTLAGLTNELEQLPARQRAAIEKIRLRTRKKEARLRREIARLSGPLYRYAEAVRAATMGFGKKIQVGTTGVARWLSARPAVTITGKESEVVAALKKKHPELVRIHTVIEEHVDKEAVAKNPSAIKGVPGIEIRVAQEAFAIYPKGSSAIVKFFLKAQTWDITWPRKKS